MAFLYFRCFRKNTILGLSINNKNGDIRTNIIFSPKSAKRLTSHNLWPVIGQRSHMSLTSIIPGVYILTQYIMLQNKKVSPYFYFLRIKTTFKELKYRKRQYPRALPPYWMSSIFHTLAWCISNALTDWKTEIAQS